MSVCKLILVRLSKGLLDRYSYLARYALGLLISIVILWFLKIAVFVPIEKNFIGDNIKSKVSNDPPKNLPTPWWATDIGGKAIANAGTPGKKLSSAAENIYSVETKHANLPVEDGFGASERKNLLAASKLSDLKKHSEAEVTLDKIITFFEGSMNEVGATYVCLANRDELISYQREHPETKKVIWLDWVFGETIYKKAWIAVEQKQFDQALLLLEKAIAFSPYKAVAYNERGHLLIRKKQWLEAGKSYLKAIELSEKYPHSKSMKPAALRGLGFILTELGDFPKAKAMYAMSLELEPNNSVALHELEYLKLQTQQNSKSTTVDQTASPR